MTTVRDLLDELASGQLNVTQVASQFAARRWSMPHVDKISDLDPLEPDPDTWDIVNSDSRLTAKQYQTLSEAYISTLRGKLPNVIASVDTHPGHDEYARDYHGRFSRKPGDSIGHPLQPRWDGVLGGERALSAIAMYADTKDNDSKSTIHWRDDRNPGWSKAATKRHYDAVSDYRGTAFDPVNKYLRGQISHAQLTNDDDASMFRTPPDKIVPFLDDMMGLSHLTDDVIVWRGSATGRGVFDGQLDGNLTGFSWREDGYSSTSANPDVAHDWFGTGGILMRILVPHGTGAIQLSPWTDDLGTRDEAELLLQRGLRHRVIADHGRDKKGTRHLDVEIY